MPRIRLYKGFCRQRTAVMFGLGTEDRSFIRINGKAIKGADYRTGMVAYLPQHDFILLLDQCYLKEIKEKEELIPYGYYRPG